MFLISAAFIIQTMDISVSSNLPTAANPGQTIDFEVTVNKGNITGFSKFQMQLPAGFTAEAVDAKDGTFSFTDQMIKIIWVSLPAENPFKLKLRITPGADVKGVFPLTGTFSFVENGERQNREFTSKINVGGATETAPASTPSTAAPIASTATPSSSTNISFTRTFSPENVAPSEFTVVTLQVSKGKVSGFGKITETIPVGYSATEMESNGAIFSVSGNSVRFLWMTLPADENFKVSYKLVADASVGKKEISGSFSYVVNEQTQLLNIPTSYFDAATTSAVAQAPAAQPATETTSTASAETEAQTTEPAKRVETASSTEAAASTPAESTSANVSYRVQICATKNPVSTDYFVKNHNVQVKIYADMHEGWHKFTVGGFPVYGEARNYREAVKESYNIKGPFVTAYNNGNRITVQEALMISKQTWVP